MSRTLLVTSNYWPEPTGIANYTTDFAENLTEGHQVSVLTSLPHYPWWSVPSKFSHLVEGIGTHNGVSVVRAKHLIPSKMNALVRMRFETSMWWNLRRVSKTMLANDFDLVVACIPTVAAGLVGMRIAKDLGIPFGLIVQDLSGVGAKQSGLRGGAVISKIANAIEGRVLHGADKLVVVSTDMRDVVAGVGVPENGITLIANYCARTISSIDKKTARLKIGWSLDDFVVIHTGNMGTKQDLENVVRAADFLLSDQKIKIYLVGHGNQETKLMSLCLDKSNISVLPAVAYENYSALLSAADLLLVNERNTQLEMSLPSKLTAYLFSGRPVIAAVPRGGATWKFLEGIAELVESGNPILLAQAIKDLSQNNDKRDELAYKGLEFARNNLGAENGRRKYLDWVNSLVQSKRG